MQEDMNKKKTKTKTKTKLYGREYYLTRSNRNKWIKENIWYDLERLVKANTMLSEQVTSSPPPIVLNATL